MAIFTPTAYWASTTTQSTPAPFSPSDLNNVRSWVNFPDGYWNFGGGGSTLFTIQDQNGTQTVSWTINSSPNPQTTSLIKLNQTTNPTICNFVQSNAEYIRSSQVTFASNGNHYIVQLVNIIGATQQNASIVTYQSTTGRDYEVEESSTGSSVRWNGRYRLNSVTGFGTTFQNWFSSNSTTRKYQNQFNIYSYIFDRNFGLISGRVNGNQLLNNLSYTDAMGDSGRMIYAANGLLNRRVSMQLAESIAVGDLPGTGGSNIDNVEKLEGYLAWKYYNPSLTNNLVNLLPSNHPYKNQAP